MLRVNVNDASDIQDSKAFGHDVDVEFLASGSEQLSELRRKIRSVTSVFRVDCHRNTAVFVRQFVTRTRSYKVRHFGGTALVPIITEND